MHRRRTVFITLLLLIGIIAVPIALTWRLVRQERLDRALIAAVDRNDTAGVRRLLRQGADPNASVLPDDNRPVWKRMWGIMRHRLIPHPCADESALLMAAEWLPSLKDWDRPSDNVDTIQALVDAGANVNMSGGRFIPPTTPLVAASYHVKWKTVKVLLSHNADVNAKMGDGRTALVFAAGEAQPDLVEALLKRGARVDEDNGNTLLYDAINAEWNRPRAAVRATVADLIRYGADVNCKTCKRGNPVLSVAQATGDQQLIQMLKRAGAK